MMSQYIQPISYERLPESEVPVEIRSRVHELKGALRLMDEVTPNSVPAERYIVPTPVVADIAAQHAVQSAVETVPELIPSAEGLQQAHDLTGIRNRVDAAYTGEQDYRDSLRAA